VWDLGPVPIRAYAVFIIAGIIVATLWGNRRFIARGGRPGRIVDLAVWMVPFGLIGGRLYHVITDPELYFCGKECNPWNAFAIWNGGLGIWGAIAMGGLGAYLGCRYYKIPLGPVADALAPGIAVAQAIGRLGNYFNQELFGSPTTLPWGLDVYLRTPGGVSGTVDDCAAAGATPEFPTTYLKASPEVLCGTFHPTFLYELIWDVGVALLVVWADRRFRLGHGRAFAVYVAGYTAGRAWIEMLRIDHANHILGLRVNVLVAIAVFLAAVVYLVLTRKLGREDPAVVWGPDVGRRGTHGDAGPAPVPAASTSPAADPAPDDPMPVDPELEDPEPDDPGPGGPIIDDREPGDSALGDPEPADPERTGARREETPRT
jgi:prolipoprotein diacylglyceryl transferase